MLSLDKEAAGGGRNGAERRIRGADGLSAVSPTGSRRIDRITPPHPSQIANLRHGRLPACATIINLRFAIHDLRGGGHSEVCHEMSTGLVEIQVGRVKMAQKRGQGRSRLFTAGNISRFLAQPSGAKNLEARNRLAGGQGQSRLIKPNQTIFHGESGHLEKYSGLVEIRFPTVTFGRPFPPSPRLWRTSRGSNGDALTPALSRRTGEGELSDVEVQNVQLLSFNGL
jgi:hypothetical protein